MFVHTAHGQGRVVDEQSVRGRKSFLVEGKGFRVWVDEKDLRVANEVNEDNSITLPYDPTPQHPTDMFKSESTIQPTNEIDPDETLSASDSLTFDDAAEYPYPGPSPDNFAKNAGFLQDILDKLPRHEWDENAISDWVQRHNPNYHPEEDVRLVKSNHSLDLVREPPQGYRGRHRPPLAPEMTLGNGYDVWDSQDWLDAHPGPQFADPREQARYQEWQDKYLGDRQFGDRGLSNYEPIYANRLAGVATKEFIDWCEQNGIDPYNDPDAQTIWARSMHQDSMGDIDFADLGLGGDSHEKPLDWGPEERQEFYRNKNQEIKHFSHRQAGAAEMLEGMADKAEDAVEAVEGGEKRKPSPKSLEIGGIVNEIKQNVEGLVDDFAGEQNKKEVGGYWPGRPDGQTVTSSLYERPAGLSDRYIRVEAHVDHYSDPVQQFRDDPVGFISKQAYIYSGAADVRLAEYINLVDSDPGIRTAAWKDVRAKALRLRREGRVHVKDIGPNRIYASVDGDTDTYETMIVKSSANQSIDHWTCNCGWGSTVGQRKVSYVGRLCSHGYASYLEMESQQMKANNKKRRKSAGSGNADPSEQEGVGDMNWGAWKRRNLDENGEVIGNPRSRKERERSRDEAYQDWIDRGTPHHGGRIAGIVEDFKQWADNENDGMIDQQAIDNFIYLLNSQQDGDHTIVSEEDAEKLYDALDGMKSTGKVRDYDVDYLERPGDVYKDASFHEADVLALRPQSLTPDFYFVEDGQDGEWWTDVTKDERKTTGPDNMVRKSARHPRTPVDRSGSDGYSDDERSPIEDEDEFTGFGWENDPREQKLRKSRRLTGRELHYASDEELGHAVKDWASAGSKLEKLRSLSADDPDLQNMRDKNDEIRGVIDELHDRGIDASQFVASLRLAAEDDDDDKNKANPASTQNQPDMSGKPNQTGQPGGSSSIVKPDAGQNKSEPNSATNPTGGGALSNPTSGDPADVGFGGGPQNIPSSDRPNSYPQIDPASVLSGLGQAAGGLSNVLPNILHTLPGVVNTIGQIGTGIGSGINSIVNGLGNLSSGLRRADLHYSTPIGGFPNVQLTNQESFQGSGPNPKFWFGSSECYVDEHERERFVDVTDLDDDAIIKYTGDKPKQGPKKTAGSKEEVRNFGEAIKHSSENQNPKGATLTSGSGMNDSEVINFDQIHKAGSDLKAWDGRRVRDFKRFVNQHGQSKPTHQMLQEYLNKPHRSLDQGGVQHLQDYTSHAEQHEASLRFDDDSDIVAQFHRMGGIEAINNSGGGGSYSDSAIADQARGFLRTAGRMYSLAEQRELENEAHPKGARNLDDLDLAGTHYEDAL